MYHKGISKCACVRLMVDIERTRKEDLLPPTPYVIIDNGGSSSSCYGGGDGSLF